MVSTYFSSFSKLCVRLRMTSVSGAAETGGGVAIVSFSFVGVGGGGGCTGTSKTFDDYYFFLIVFHLIKRN